MLSPQPLATTRTIATLSIVSSCISTYVTRASLMTRFCSCCHLITRVVQRRPFLADFMATIMFATGNAKTSRSTSRVKTWRKKTLLTSLETGSTQATHSPRGCKRQRSLVFSCTSTAMVSTRRLSCNRVRSVFTRATLTRSWRNCMRKVAMAKCLSSLTLAKVNLSSTKLQPPTSIWWQHRYVMSQLCLADETRVTTYS